MKNNHMYVAKMSVAIFTLLSLASLSHAHHSFAPYDIRNPIVVTGTAEKFRYAAPHAQLILLDEKGVEWDIEVPNRRWERSGIAKDAIAAGDDLIVKMFPARNGDPEAAISGFTKEGTYYSVTEEIRQQSGNEAADAIEAGEDAETVIERYRLPD